MLTRDEIRSSAVAEKPRFIPLQPTSPLGGLHRNTEITFGVEKAEWCVYLMVKKFRICLAVSTQYRRVTDRRTDRQTDRHLATA